MAHRAATTMSELRPQARQFMSDNSAGICPEALEALHEANSGHAAGYGEDPWTERARQAFRELFETDCQVFYTFTGTASNALALGALCRSFEAIICHELAHIHTDECGAVGFFTGGAKILARPGPMGRLAPRAVRAAALRRRDVHFPRARVLSVTQATELGTLYSVKQLQALCGQARACDLYVHMDGARFANACAALNVAPKQLTWMAGVDVLTFGGAKNGMALGEAVVFFRQDLAQEFARRQLQAGQTASKMRFLAAPWAAMITTGAWLRNARQANACAARLAQALRGAPGLTLLAPAQANAVFASLPPAAAQGLAERGWRFLSFVEQGGARFMCAWDHTFDDVDQFAAEVHRQCRLAAEP